MKKKKMARRALTRRAWFVVGFNKNTSGLMPLAFAISSLLSPRVTLEREFPSKNPKRVE